MKKQSTTPKGIRAVDKAIGTPTNFIPTFIKIEFADAFHDWYVEHTEWSQETFGSDSERGPLGPLRHLQKEVREAIDAAVNNPEDHSELADCFTLIIDAARRAGVKPIALLNAAREKLEVNKKRSWPKPTGDDLAIEHVRHEEL